MDRHCGDCTLCCKLVPVQALAKPANTRCRHQSSKGCAVYKQLNTVSPECRLWNCRWLVDPATAGLRRPDRVHYVLDLVPGFVGAREGNEGPWRNVQVLQIWADPAHKHAWRYDDALVAYLLKLAEEEGMAALVRYGNARATFIAAPPLTQDGKWIEREDATKASGEWTDPMEIIHNVAQEIRRARG